MRFLIIRDGVLQGVELPLLGWYAGFLAIGLHGTPQGPPIHGDAAVGDEQIRRGVGTGSQGGAQEFDDIGLQGRDAGKGTFQPLDLTFRTL
jgi:hypothetical protein